MSDHSQSDLPKNHFRITVVSATLPTYADLIANYGVENMNKICDEKHYRVGLHESLRDLTPPMGEVTVFLKKFGRPTMSEKAIKWANEHGYRLVFPWEREAFAKTSSNLQWKLQIVDIASRAHLDVGDRRTPRLYEINGWPCLDSRWRRYAWPASYRFLFASK